MTETRVAALSESLERGQTGRADTARLGQRTERPRRCARGTGA